jgi:type IV pilus assembly protein PilE
VKREEVIMKFNQFKAYHGYARSIKGFTLIEVLVVVAIIGILSAVAIPSYNDYVVRGKLPEATGALADARVRMEQAYSDNRTYAGGGTGGCGVTLTSTEYFTLTCAPGAGGQSYLITATAVAGKGVDGFAYTINNQNIRTTTSWGAVWGAVPAAGATKWLIRKS